MTANHSPQSEIHNQLAEKWARERLDMNSFCIFPLYHSMPFSFNPLGLPALAAPLRCGDSLFVQDHSVLWQAHLFCIHSFHVIILSVSLGMRIRLSSSPTMSLFLSFCLVMSCLLPEKQKQWQTIVTVHIQWRIFLSPIQTPLPQTSLTPVASVYGHCAYHSPSKHSIFQRSFLSPRCAF